jgi:hypothetical protein
MVDSMASSVRGLPHRRSHLQTKPWKRRRYVTTFVQLPILIAMRAATRAVGADQPRGRIDPRHARARPLPEGRRRRGGAHPARGARDAPDGPMKEEMKATLAEYESTQKKG